MKVILKISKPGSKNWTVKGKDLEEVVKNLDGNKWWGKYDCPYTYKTSIKDGKVEAIQIDSKPVITMPKWAGLSKATKEEKKSWDVMIKALFKHENEHHTVFLKTIEAWKKKVEAGGNLDKKAMATAWKAFEKVSKKQQEDFDKKTDHGAKKGVVLDIPKKKK